ncbi:PHP domain-containing protein [Candidatus Woesearchaeota archaeon]|nr:PHP domain-containing protein [Candidatus Woesearchaeota archaeon]
MVKLDLHIHSCYSKNTFGTEIWMPPSMSKPSEILKVAFKSGFRAIAIMDHDNVNGGIVASKIAKKYNIIVLKGSEISSKDGHILAYGIEENVPPKLSAEETLDRIKDLGGFPVIPHPFNLKLSLKKEMVLKLRKRITGIEVYNSHSFTNSIAKNFAEKHKIPKTAGSDAHTLREIGNSFCETDYPLNNPYDIIKAIKRNALVPNYCKKASIIFDIMPCAVASFCYWRFQQAHRLISPDAFLPF